MHRNVSGRCQVRCAALRIPGAARNQTTAGEDPFLIGELGVSEIHAMQSEGLMSEPKHFALYNQSTNTGGGGAMLNVNADEQTRHEIYFRPFEAAVEQGGIAAVMCSYNKSLGQYSYEQPVLLNDVLRGKWGLEGFVLSDYGATHSLSILQGLDTSFPSGDPYFTTDLTAVVTRRRPPTTRPWRRPWTSRWPASHQADRAVEEQHQPAQDRAQVHLRLRHRRHRPGTSVLERRPGRFA